MKTQKRHHPRLDEGGPVGWHDHIWTELTTALKQGHPIIFTGPTGSGKTTCLSVLLEAMCSHERVVLLEDIPELPCMSPHWIGIQSQVPPIHSPTQHFDLERVFTQVLRLRPDRLVIGEVRSQQEATVFLHALEVAQKGVITSIHIREGEDLSTRLTLLTGQDTSRLLSRRPYLAIAMRRGSPPIITQASWHR